MVKQWYIIYTEWGQEKRVRFGNDEKSAREFAEITENARVYFGFC